MSAPSAEEPEVSPRNPADFHARAPAVTPVSAVRAVQTELAETRIADRYRVERLLGQGGMGAVYVVFDEHAHRQVALKRLRAGGSQRATQLFEREYQTLASLRHAGIVQAYDFGRDERGAYYTMELVHGTELSKLAPLPWREVCACLRDVASILGILHARTLVHRDLSPRNLLRDADRRLKLIDFGALASFGPSTEIVGTPPFVPPEAVALAQLDARSDLYSLGALGYWLLTGVNAFPARNLTDLSALWERVPAAPSSLVALIENTELPAVPAALDELLSSLLRVSPRERPTSTDELIDRLTAIADLPPEAHEHAIEGYLNSKVMVGRTRERERVRSALEESLRGTGRALLIEGDPGIGRTRFLADALVAARLSGIVALHVDASKGDAPYAAAQALSLQALAFAPEAARVAIAVHAPVLGRLSTELHQRLGGGALAAESAIPGEDRAEAQRALHALFVTLSEHRALALLVDDLDQLDEESRGLIVALAHGIDRRAMLIVATASRDVRPSAASAVVSYRSAAQRITLAALATKEILELLRSVFGGAQYLERTADRLQRVAAGNPAHAVALIEHLVRTKAARYHEGAWALPADLSHDSLPSSRNEAYLARLLRISPRARALARALSVPHHGPFSEAQCVAVGGLGAERTRALLDDLVRERVLVASAQGFDFAHADLRHALIPELTETARARVHLLLAESILASVVDPQVDPLRAAIHFLRAGEEKRAAPLVLQASSTFVGAGINSKLRVAAPLFEEIYELSRAKFGEDRYVLAEPLSVLALAGYFVDRRYAQRYGDLAVETLSKLLKLGMLRVLSRLLPRKLALVVTLIVAGIGLRLRRKRGPRLPLVIKRLLSIVSALAGTAAICMDVDKILELSRVIEPFTALGPDHAATIVHRFTTVVAVVDQDRLWQTNVELRSVLARLESERPIAGLDAGSRRNYIAAALYSLGLNESRREGSEVLRVVEQLDQHGSLYALSADRLREYFYEHRGDMARAAAMHERVEVHAVQLGTAWQVETWAPLKSMETAIRTHDAMLMKRSATELARLSSEVPALALHERTARGSYLVMRGKYAEALTVLEREREPEHVIGWAFERAMLARAYRGLGRHEDARAVCEQVMSRLGPEEAGYTGQKLTVQTELALAEAGLGRYAEANMRLDALLARFADCENPITLALLHEARARVALVAHDFATARTHLEEVAKLVRPTGAATWQQQVAKLERELDALQNPQAAVHGGARLLDDVSHLMTRVSVVLQHSVSTMINDRAKKVLQIAVELSNAVEGFVVLPESVGDDEIFVGTRPARELTEWARGRMEATALEQRTQLVDDVTASSDEDELVTDGMHYRAAILTRVRDGEDMVVGALVLAADEAKPKMPNAAVLRRIAEHVAGEEELGSGSV